MSSGIKTTDSFELKEYCFEKKLEDELLPLSLK